MANPERSNMAEGSGQGPEGPTLIIPPNKGEIREGEYSINPPPQELEQPAQPSLEDRIAGAVSSALSRQGEGGRPSPEKRSQTPPSEFKDVVARIKTFERDDPNNPELTNLRERRDQLRHEANLFGWLTAPKEELFDLHYNSRVKVDRDQKHGTDEWKRRTGAQYGTLELLKLREDAAAEDSWEDNWVDEDRHIRGFWNSVLVEQTINRLNSQGVTIDGQPVTKENLRGQYGGVIDDFMEESLKMIRAVVVDRHMFDPRYRGEAYDRARNKYHSISDDYYNHNGLTSIDADGNGLWNLAWTSEITGETVYLKNFEDVRDFIEHERKKKYFIPNLGDYSSYIKLVVDDIEEVRECIPYMLSFFKYKFGTGEPKKVNEGYEEEIRKLHTALEKLGQDFGYEREQPVFREFRRVLSEIDHNLKLLENYEFSDLAYLDWQPYLQSGADLARGFQDTEYQDSIPDTILLDRDGLTMLALQEFEKNDGEYWRFGSNNADTRNDTRNYLRGRDAHEWQERRKEEMRENLMKKRLRTMDNLLNLTVDRNGHITAYGDPRHPAFQRLKAKFDALDERDRQGGKPLVDAYGKSMTRWEEYCEKAMAWQRNQTFTEEITVKDKNGRDVKVTRKVFRVGDVRDYRQRVLFQHPLARYLSEEEFNLMYEEIDPDASEFRRERAEKERKINSIIGISVDSVGSAERMARAFQEDAAAGLARHILSFEQMRAIGLIPADAPQNYNIDQEHWPVYDSGAKKGQRIPREVLHYALDLENKPILKDGKLVPEAVPHKVLLKHLCKLAMDREWKKIKGNKDDEDKIRQRRMRFKLSYVMDKMGIRRSLPLFSNWYLGAHDSVRPNWLADIQHHLPGFAELIENKKTVRKLDSDDEFGGDEKVVLTRAVEDERELVELMEMYIRDKYGDFFNFPGHDFRGGGNKEARNLFLLPYGQSRGTVEMNSLIPHIWLGETDFLSAYGCSNWREFMGIYKLSDEADYKERGSLFETPRDAEYWFRRVGAIIEQQKLWISDTDKGKAVLNSGWGSGFFLWRTLNRSARFITHKEHKIIGSDEEDLTVNQFTTIEDPKAAYEQMDEKTYEDYIKLGYQFLAPLITIFEARQKLENVYGRSPGTAKFLNTLTWYAVSRWMDDNYEEFRGKYGNALDVNLHMARKFIRTALYEGKYIFYDDEMDQRMLGYTIPEDDWKIIKDWDKVSEEDKKKHRPITKFIAYQTDAADRARKYIETAEGRVIFGDNFVEGERVMGLLDAFPIELRDEIINRHNNKDQAWIIPMGLRTEYPEHLGIIKELAKREGGSKMRNFYEFLFHPDQLRRQIRERITIIRPAAERK